MDEKETSASAGTLIGSCASAADAFPVNEETSTAARLSSEADTAGIAAVASIPVDSAVITAPRPIGAARSEERRVGKECRTRRLTEPYGKEGVNEEGERAGVSKG